MTEELCSYGKKYPCAECKEPCPAELKRREFYSVYYEEEDWEEDEDWEDEDFYEDDEP